MNKELTPLEVFRELKESIEYKGGDFYCANEQRLNIIENALKEYVGFQIVFKLSNRNEGKKVYDKLKALEIIKECFVLNGFDELIPNSKWFESEEKQALLKEVLI